MELTTEEARRRVWSSVSSPLLEEEVCDLVDEGLRGVCRCARPRSSSPKFVMSSDGVVSYTIPPFVLGSILALTVKSTVHICSQFQ